MAITMIVAVHKLRLCVYACYAYAESASHAHVQPRRRDEGAAVDVYLYRDCSHARYIWGKGRQGESA